MCNDPWQRFHSTTPYFMPFMLWRDGSVEPSIAYALIAAWFLVLAALISVLLLLRAKARTGVQGTACRIAGAFPPRSIFALHRQLRTAEQDSLQTDYRRCTHSL